MLLQHAPRASTPATGQSRLSVQAKISRVLVALFVADVIVMGTALVVAWRLRTQLGVWDKVLVNEDSWLLTFAAILIVWLGWLAAHGAYSARAFGGGPDEFKSVLLASFLTAGTVGMGCYLLGQQPRPRLRGADLRGRLPTAAARTLCRPQDRP